jgi:stress response protein SCP2
MNMVSLSKNQTVSLSKQSSAISQLQFGLGWDPVKKKGYLATFLAAMILSIWTRVAFCWTVPVIKLTRSGFVN